MLTSIQPDSLQEIPEGALWDAIRWNTCLVLRLRIESTSEHQRREIAAEIASITSPSVRESMVLSRSCRLMCFCRTFSNLTGEAGCQCSVFKKNYFWVWVAFCSHSQLPGFCRWMQMCDKDGSSWEKKETSTDFQHNAKSFKDISTQILSHINNL